MFADGERFGSAVVFSPTFFSDEETSWLYEFFARNRYYLRPLVAQNASLATFDFHAQYFPYDLLHICSHGGEVDGYKMSEHFTDRDGKTHTSWSLRRSSVSLPLRTNPAWLPFTGRYFRESWMDLDG